jgi:hypothetical protein
LAWIGRVTAKQFTRNELLELETELPEILTRLMVVLPMFFFTIQVHLLLHLAGYIRLFGPLHSTWMFKSEQLQSIITSKSHAKQNAEVSNLVQAKPLT